MCLCVCVGVWVKLAHREVINVPKRIVKYEIINITNGPHEENGFINILNKEFMKMQKAFYEI